jgi:dipeptidase E
MNEAGFEVEDLDIEDRNADELRAILRGKDAVYVQGGNTFYLLKWVRESAFGEVVKELIEQGIVYIGVSAGSYIACPTIEPAIWKGVDKNTVGLTDFTALGLVPFLMFVHFEPAYAGILRKEIPGAHYSVKILTDGQAILIQGKEIKLVGRGEEIRV